jgi:hypothetical protein
MPIGPLYGFFDSGWNTFVKVEGVWVEQGKKPDASTPLKTAVVECYKSASLCISANADGSAYIKLEWFHVERWDQYKIVSEPKDIPCGRETIRITRPDHTVLANQYWCLQKCRGMYQTVWPARGANGVPVG